MHLVNGSRTKDRVFDVKILPRSCLGNDMDLIIEDKVTISDKNALFNTDSGTSRI
jgi:hypothetical protein